MRKFNITVNGKAYEVEVDEVGGAAPAPRAAAPKSAPVAAPAAAPAAPVAAPAAAAPAAAPVPAGANAIKSPMPGKILDIKVAVGDKISRGQVVLVLEAMKMQNDIPSPADGTVSAIRTSVGASVAAGDVLVVL
jgi:glutaconyl-CoA decarboxylase